MDYGKLKSNIENLLEQQGILKNKICKELDIPCYNFNRYCRDEFQRMDASSLCKLCWYLKMDVSQLVEHLPSEQK